MQPTRGFRSGNSVANQVERYARTVDTSIEQGNRRARRLGVEGQESRKWEFFRSLKANLENDDPQQQDRLVDEFRALILGR